MTKLDNIKSKRKIRVLGHFHVDEWDEEIFVRDVPARVGLAKIEKATAADEGTESAIDGIVDALQEFLCDEDGRPVFADQEGRDVLAETGFLQLKTLIEETMRIYTGGPEKNEVTLRSANRSTTKGSATSSRARSDTDTLS